VQLRIGRAGIFPPTELDFLRLVVWEFVQLERALSRINNNDLVEEILDVKHVNVYALGGNVYGVGRKKFRDTRFATTDQLEEDNKSIRNQMCPESARRFLRTNHEAVVAQTSQRVGLHFGSDVLCGFAVVINSRSEKNSWLEFHTSKFSDEPEISD
jgi:hypothetical protein